MKGNKKLVRLIAAGVAVAGLGGFLLGTEKGRSTTKKLKQHSGNLAQKAGGLLADGRKKIMALKDRKPANGFKENAQTSYHQQEAGA